jgi:hypothetical protein
MNVAVDAESSWPRRRWRWDFRASLKPTLAAKYAAGRGEIKVKNPALANYRLERGTLKFAFDAVGPPTQQGQEQERSTTPPSAPKNGAEG